MTTLPGCLWDEYSSAQPCIEADSIPPTADVVIVGAGLTGLWSAHYLQQRFPGWKICILEKYSVGFGASGRNGGWCSSLLPMSLESLEKSHGAVLTTAMQCAMHDTVDEIDHQITALDINCDFQKGGSIDVCRSPSQLQKARARVDTARRFNIDADHLRILSASETRSVVNMQGALSAVFDADSAVLHPRKLVTGLAQSLRQRGVEIYEGVEVRSLSPTRVHTNKGNIDAGVIIRATEAFTSSLKGHSREILPLYSLMIATEPLTQTLWDDIGLKDRTTFNDGRNMIIYGQRTADGRLAFGGRGAPYHFGSAIRPQFDRNKKVREMLQHTLLELFPVLHGTAFTHHWGGPLGAARDWHSSVTFDRATGIATAGGYVGDGVATANLAARTLTDLISGQQSHLTTLPWVNHISRKWEPEPIRFFAVNTMTKLASIADNREAKTGRGSQMIEKLLSRLTS